MVMEIGECSTRRLKALIVDDKNIERKINGRALRNLNFETVEAINGQDAVVRVLSGETFDLVIMDRSMPVMDGVTATKILREMGGKFKIIALTSDAEFKDEFTAAGADKFFTKPLDPKELEEALRKFELIA
ncbi:hypothetical protein LUZ60_015720 [Juncus effusus]|nr:hypothetical protein LUZ60_015720 [Juncus effusus]